MPEWIEVSVRTLSAIVVLFIATKILGKRQITQLSLFEYITGITIGNMAATISLDTDSAWYLGVISLAIWVVISMGIGFIQMKSKKARDFLDGKATVVIKNGKILEENLRKERLTTDELLEQLRYKNVFRAADVEFAIMEPTGDINILLKKEYQPLTADHLGVKMKKEAEPQAVIMDGVVLEQALSKAGLNRRWLEKELKKMHLNPQDVFLAQVDAKNKLYVDLYDDDLSNS